MNLKQQIEQLYAQPAQENYPEEYYTVFNQFKEQLNDGTIRIAEKQGDNWIVHDWVKKGVLLGFRVGSLKDYSIDDQFKYFDKDTYPLKTLSLNNRVRMVPGGSSIRDGCYVSPGVVCMPPMYINVGAYVDSGTMIDSHALVGSCAQIGKNVHISAAAQIGGVLEPIGALPVIIEDEVLIGGNCGVYEGAVIRKGAIIGSGVILTGSTPVYDLVNETIYQRSGNKPLEIPENAVVIAGSRRIDNDWADQYGLSIYTPIIVKYRDDKTDKAVELEDWLR
ncbi:MAG: 2,3,4,5-tetrahydropyridine-2,6-dicarboxylate N-succinyltransferase [Calditrichaceae bacterium]|nr:2,3,4,5-tetrahydropyridine-2,6-dicarboxylate N-succinyltransferase [Calditrichaceae bacterium]